jgi:hypothetical protein
VNYFIQPEVIIIVGIVGTVLHFVNLLIKHF